MLTNEDYKLPIPRLLRKFRFEYELTQRRLGEYLDCDNKTINRWEKGRGVKERDIRLKLKGLEVELCKKS